MKEKDTPNKNEFNWIDDTIVGMALLLKGGSIDSFGNKIYGNVFYKIGKHRITGQVAVIPTNRN